MSSGETFEFSLEALAEQQALNDWVFSRLRPHLRSPGPGRPSILEIGCGIGTYTGRLASVGDVTALDPEAVAVEHARLRVTSDVRFLVGGVDDVLDDLAPPYDAAVCINVLEHIRDDEGTLRTIHALLRPGGTLLLLVPAGPWLYGSLDRAFGHERRYRRAELARLLERTGFRHDGVPSFNMLGIPGWFAAAKMLGHTELRPGLLGVYRVLAPPFRWFEDRFGAPVGLSLFTVAVRS